MSSVKVLPGKTATNQSVELSICRDEDGNEEFMNEQDIQHGIQEVEAITQIWTAKALAAAYLMIWIIYFVEGMLSGTQIALLPYVTSSFAEHSLTPTISIVSSVIGGCTNFTIAKILDVFGRPRGYLLCVIIAEVGLIMMAACRHVEAYAAALVFYTVGNTGLQYCLSVFVADTSSLRNRGLMQAFAYSPNMITCWLAGPIASAFLTGPGWPWAFGMFAVLVPAVSIPLYAHFEWNSFKAKRKNLADALNDKARNPWESFIHYSREFDAIGLILLSAGVACFLLPFNLYTLQAASWASATVISLLAVGVVLLVFFVIWENFLAPVTFIPTTLLLDRTVIGSCILAFTLFFSYFCWNSYFSSFLQVVNDLSVIHTSYVMQIYTVVSVLVGFAAGTLIRSTGRFKSVCLWGSIPLNILGTALMIYFRQPSSGVRFVIMCQIFISFAAGIVIICNEVAVLAVASHQHIAVSLATLGFFGNIGGAIGLTVTSAIWQNTIPKKLAAYLPVEELANLEPIYTDIKTQLSYPVGTPARLAIQHAYGDAQKNILIAACSVWFLGILGVALWRDIDVSKIKQVKGEVI